MSRSRRASCLALALACTSLVASAQAGDPGVRDESKFDPKRSLSNELQTSVQDGFRLIAVGDCIISRPLSQYASREPAFAESVKVLKGGDATYGNLETSILDLEHFKGFPYTGADDVPLLAAPGVASDLAVMGFDLMSRANNHALDWGIEGMRDTTRWTDKAGIITAGVGENQGLARAAYYFESAKGRIGIVSLASTFRPTSEALPERGAAPGRPGVSSLTVKKTVMVPANVMRDLQSIAKELYPAAPVSFSANDKDHAKLTLFDTNFEIDSTRKLKYEMDADDLAGILKAVRQGKQHADFLLVTIHSHESSDMISASPKNDFDDTPADFVHELAKAAIDAGADAFLATGIHHLGPIEIYKGRPIFYGLGDFFWSDIQEPLPADAYLQYRHSVLGAFKEPARATDADIANVLNAQSFAGDLPFESVITESRFDHGRLTEIRLYPVDLGYGMKLTESGIPRVASAEKASKVLNRLRSVSATYGTKLQIESSPDWHYVGVIRP
jgi:poly-gamma-glutamate capsule biosynthesis protein CapA/YwtB (metallophosphatase superfamily)